MPQLGNQPIEEVFVFYSHIIVFDLFVSVMNIISILIISGFYTAYILTALRLLLLVVTTLLSPQVVDSRNLLSIFPLNCSNHLLLHCSHILAANPLAVLKHDRIQEAHQLVDIQRTAVAFYKLFEEQLPSTIVFLLTQEEDRQILLRFWVIDDEVHEYGVGYSMVLRLKHLCVVGEVHNHHLEHMGNPPKLLTLRHPLLRFFAIRHARNCLIVQNYRANNWLLTLDAASVLLVLHLLLKQVA